MEDTPPRTLRARRLLSAGRRLGRTPRRLAILLTAATFASVAMPVGAGEAAPGRPMPSLHELLRQAKVLSEQVNALSEQYDGLRIQLAQAREEAKIAERTYQQDSSRLHVGQLTIGQLAAQTYMNGGMDSTLEILTSSTPQLFMNRAAIMEEIQSENGDRVSQFAAAVAAAERAHQAAIQQQQQVSRLKAEMAVKQRQAQAKIRILNSAVFAKAMQVFQQTGNYPNIDLPTANTIGAQALRYALTRRGDPYVWGAAGPNAFDCSGLVLWAYAQVGISLPHYTGDQWNMGIHVSRNDLQPGDLVFFYPTIEHVGLYIGNGLMVDAPDFGEVVQVQPVMWDVYVGAVRIVG